MSSKPQKPQKAKPKKEKKMYQAYDPDQIPDSMPFPDIYRVDVKRSGDVVVPQLNKHQRNWILDVGLNGVDFATHTNQQQATDIFNRVKLDAFEAKAFKHTPQPADKEEEARLPEMIATYKAANKKSTPNDDDTSDDVGEEDADARTGLLRGYTIEGWRQAIMKVLSNKKSAQIRKGKAKAVVIKSESADASKPAPPDAEFMKKALGLQAYTGRDKFRDEMRTAITAHADTLSGGNAGGTWRKAEAELWEMENHAEWEGKAASNEDVDWNERQSLIGTGFQHMVDELNSSGKFLPFLATMTVAWLDETGVVRMNWVEGIPSKMDVHRSFKDECSDAVESIVNRFHDFAKKPLQNYAAALKVSKKQSVPLFPISVAEGEDMDLNDLKSVITSFLRASFDSAFGSEDVPWSAIATNPNKYYDPSQFTIKIPASGPDAWKARQWYDAAEMLATVAGVGSGGFFRKEPKPDSAPPPPSRPSTPRPEKTPPPRSRPVTPQRTPAPSRAPTPERISPVPPSRAVTPEKTPPPARDPTPILPPSRVPTPVQTPVPSRSGTPEKTPPPSRERTPPPPPPRKQRNLPQVSPLKTRRAAAKAAEAEAAAKVAVKRPKRGRKRDADGENEKIENEGRPNKRAKH
ncbi:acid protease [Favolaschia claudopus]|uniref:Acid protease n=1 Tax=Favolaschia claudopus TaxID=2862362 RepID=A0AAV9Z712_9AGAR